MVNDELDKSRKKPIVGIACGGTGGHIFPGLAVAEALKTRGYPVILWLAGKDIEKIALTEWKDKIYRLQILPISGRNPFKILFAFYNMCKAFFICRKGLKAEKVSLLLAMGSYASIPPALAARSLGIKLILHEANAIPGRAVKFLAKYASKVALAFEEAKEYLPATIDTQFTGMPIRKLTGKKINPATSKEKGVFTLLVMGGSRGAASLNRIVPQAIAQLKSNGFQLKVIHIAGITDEQVVREAYQKEATGIPARVISFTHNMGEIYAEADLAICRAGASTCAELLQYGIPSILIPYPYATNQHQLINAMVMEKRGASFCLQEKDLSSQSLARMLQELLNAPEELAKMRENALNYRIGDADERLVRVIEEALDNK